MSIVKGLKTRVLWLLSTALFLGACQIDQGFTDIEVPVEEEEEVIAAYPGVEEALWVYFDRFEKEGVLRGREIDLRETEVTGIIEEIEEEGIAGQCSYASHQSNHVAIDKQFWDQASDLLREFVVFHELGHCSLGRDHREDAKADGTCESIMASGVGDCRDNYKSVTREGYLDELYDPSFGGEIF